MTENIIISNLEALENSKKLIAKAGAKNLHILADFDRTLTKAFVDGKNTPSLISVLRDNNFLTPDYAEKANSLYAKYHPIEIDPKIFLEEKKKAMKEWWQAHFDLLIKSKLNKQDLKRVIELGKVQLRQGASDFFDFLHSQSIPLVIMSSSGLGDEVIAMYLTKENRLHKNIHIVSNSYEWDENGNAIGYKKPIIHAMNKDETAIQDFPFFDEIKNRKNVLLLGDSLGDVGMIQGFDYDNLIKIGFLNENIEESLEQYKNNYDIVLLNDAPMDYVNNLLREIVNLVF